VDWRYDRSKGEASDLEFGLGHLVFASWQAFRNNENHEAKWTNPKVLLAHGPILKDLLLIVKDILTIVFGDGDDKASAELSKDIGNLINDVNKNDAVWGGTHLNGWIAKYCSFQFKGYHTRN
jgi:hypothetical protein